MMKILQISSELNVGSVGRIAEQIGEAIINNGGISYIAYGRESRKSSSISYKIGSRFDIYIHVLYTRLTDKHGFSSKRATKKLVEKIREINPDIIHLHHMHGYFINIEILFNFLAKENYPVVWTFHDCWSFTGHAAYYEKFDYDDWENGIFKDPLTKEYPKSFIDNSKWNYFKKKELFSSIKDMTIVPVSNWLAQETKLSFLRKKDITVIHNGIDLTIFSPITYNLTTKTYPLNQKKFIILGVANPWSKRKGLDYFIKLSELLDDSFQIILIGLSKKQIDNLPSQILGIKKTNNIQQLAEYYSFADVFVNPTLEDTFPTTNLEALACGTPVITFLTGGSPEALSPRTGIIVEKGNLEKLKEAILEVQKLGKTFFSKNCRERAEKLFDKNITFLKYIELYNNILQKRNSL